MSGVIVGVAGPSGVGKDSVMQAMAAADPRIHLVRRVITRDQSAGGEVFDGVTEDAFETMITKGAFALHWTAHGMRYGVPNAELAPVRRGDMCLVNLSRSVLVEAQARFDGFVVLLLSAAEDVLAKRLLDRDRESAEEIESRLQRADFAVPEGLKHVIRIANDGTLSMTAAQALEALQAERV